MPEYVELDNGLTIPATEVREIMAARMRGDNMAALEHAASLERLIEDLTDRMVTGQMADVRNIELMTPQARQHLLRSMRRIRHTNPLAKHAVNLVLRYTFGMGITWKAKNEETIAPIIREFWTDPDNRLEITEHQAMSSRCDELLTDGDVFFTLFSGEDGRVKVRHLPPEEIVDVVTHPHDQMKPIYYRRWRIPIQYDYQTGMPRPLTTPVITYIPAWNNYNVEQDKLTNPFFRQNPQALDDSMRVYHVSINKVGKLGRSEFFAPRDWLKSFTQFVEDRVTINRAAAAIAWQRKVKGASGKDISDAVARGIAGKEFQFGDQTITLPPVSGSTVTTPDNVEYRWTRGDTGAAAAVEDGRTLLMIFGTGIGLPIHWFGEGGDANLATAKAMNFPVFRMFMEHQQRWTSIFEFFHDYVIAKAVEAGKIEGAQVIDTTHDFGGDKPEIVERRYELPDDLSTFIDVDFPPLVQEDMKTTVEALSTAWEKVSSGNIEAKKDYAAAALTALGFNNIDEMVERHFEGVTEVPQPTPTAGAPTTERGALEWVRQGRTMVNQLREMSAELAGSSRNGHGG